MRACVRATVGAEAAGDVRGHSRGRAALSHSGIVQRQELPAACSVRGVGTRCRDASRVFKRR